MIVSASYRTDIPAMYGRWFMNRLDAGFCDVINPYGGASYHVSLKPDDVDGIVFWTKNITPFFDVLIEVNSYEIPFVVQFSITGYPRHLESSVPGADKTIRAMHKLADCYGPRAVVWRYDPILDTELTPFSWHLDNFTALARGLKGATDEVVISFVHFYRKTRRNMAKQDLLWRDPAPQDKKERAARLAEIAAENGMALTLCSQPEYQPPDVGPARCIDAVRLADIAGAPISVRRKGNRPGCGCYESRDIGAYDSCALGCVYCYAVRDRARAQARHRRHDPESSFLIPPEQSCPT